MKKLYVTDNDLCAACKSCEVACSEAFYKKYDPSLSCVQIGTKKDEKTPKINVCVQCGKCAKACPVEAITKNAKGVYMIDKKKCTGCMECIEVCPFGVLVQQEGNDIPSKCIACGICVKACPMEILTIKES